MTKTTKKLIDLDRAVKKQLSIEAAEKEMPLKHLLEQIINQYANQ